MSEHLWEQLPLPIEHVEGESGIDKNVGSVIIEFNSALCIYFFYGNFNFHVALFAIKQYIKKILFRDNLKSYSLFYRIKLLLKMCSSF